MDKKRKGSHGAVTVFLTLILVPCIIVTCAFDDISRVQLSKAGAASAADLALYSLLADYDVDLKEYYGLVASCQDIDDFYDKTATYFCGMMDAAGVSGEGSELFLDYLASLKGSSLSDFFQSGTSGKKEVSDFLQVEITKAAEVSAAENAELGDNPALIEDGIVEFMKYRGPVEIVKNVIDRFTDLDLSGASSDVDENAKIVEKKEEYANAEGDLLSAALYSYIAVHNYEKAWKNGNPLAQKGYGGLSQDLSHIWNDLKSVTELTTKYYFADTDHIAKISFPVFSNINIYAGDYKAENVGAAFTQEDGSTIYCVNAAKLQALLKGIHEAVSKAESARNSVESRFPQYSGDVNPAVYLLEVQDAFSSGSELHTISDTMNQLLKRYGQIKAAAGCDPFPENNDLPADWKNQLNQAAAKIQNLQKTFSESGSSTYIKRVKEYNSCASAHLNQIKNKGYTFQSGFTGSTETLGTFAAQMASRLPELRSELQELIDKLTTAVKGGMVDINGRQENAVSLDELVEKAKTYQNARQQWGNTADQYQHDTEYAAQESAAYHGTSDDAESEALAKEIHADAVSELKERLMNIRRDMQDFLNALDAFTYGGTKVDAIQSAGTLVTLGRTAMPGRSSRLLSQNAADAAVYFSSLMHPGTDTVFQAPPMDNGKNGNNPDLAVHTPGLYAFFKDKFQGRIDEIEKKKKENDKKNEGYKEDAKREKESSQEIDNSLLAGKGDDITGGHGGGAVNIGTAISSIVTVISNILNGSGDELRDQLYVCEYIMDMFSYSTINLEKKGKKEDNENSQAQQLKKSLTNREISHDNNKANLGEVEYILYGKSSIDGNLGAAYGNIFTIREAVNLVSGFVNFYNRSDNDTAKAIQIIAAGVAASTGGVVPVPLTKCILIGVLATMESSHDLNQLKKGKPVVFYKPTDKEWHYAFNGNGFSSGSKKSTDDEKGMYYSDYMYLFLMSGLTSGLYRDMLLRTGDLVEANMQMSGKTDFDLSKARCYFHLTAEVQVKPLMLTLPIVNSMDGVDPSGLLENKDWCTYQVDIYRGYS